MKLDQVKEQPQKILIYGQPKTGKSLLASTLVYEGYNLIWIDCEKVLQTLISHLDPKYYPQIEAIQITDNRETHLAIETCTKLMSGKPFKVCDTHGKIACAVCSANTAKLSPPPTFTEVCLGDKSTNYVVVFDSLSQISTSAVHASTKDIGDFDKKEHKHYEKLGLHLSIFLSAVQQAPFHIVCISHADVSEDVDKKEKVFPVCGTRQYGRQVGKYFDHVVYTQIVNKKFVAASSAMHNPRITAGSRSSLAMETGDVTLGDLLKAKYKEGGMDSNVTSTEQADGSSVATVKQNPLQAKLAAARRG